MSVTFTLTILLILSTPPAKAHSGKAHVHGAGELAIAFEKNQGRIEFRSAAEAILGFEHEARTPEEKKVLAEVRQRFEKEIATMVKLDPAIQCRFETSRIDAGTKVEAEPKEKPAKHGHKGGGHADFVAEFALSCQKSPRGGSLTVDFSKLKRLKKVAITVLVDDLQKSARYQGQPVKVDLQ